MFRSADSAGRGTILQEDLAAHADNLGIVPAFHSLVNVILFNDDDPRSAAIAWTWQFRPDPRRHRLLLRCFPVGLYGNGVAGAAPASRAVAATGGVH
jgi:hypothetical protein